MIPVVTMPIESEKATFLFSCVFMASLLGSNIIR